MNNNFIDDAIRVNDDLIVETNESNQVKIQSYIND